MRRSSATAALAAAALGLACAGPTEVAAPVAEEAPVAAQAAEAPRLEPPTDIPHYFERPITDADLEDRTLRELAILRNTIFARWGQPFRKAWLDRHFRAYAWYTPVDAPDFSRMTEVDRANAKKIAEYEASIPRESLLIRREEWEARTEDGGEAAQIEVGLLSIALGDWGGDPSVPPERRSPLQDPTVLDRELTEAQLADLSRRDLRLVRNLIFARHGRRFQSPILQDYFAQKAWYAPDPAYTDDRLTEVDRKNVALVVKVEQEAFGGLLGDEAHAEEDALAAQSAIFTGA